MPKIKDLGIKVIPETMQPPEIGGGAGFCITGTQCLPTFQPCVPTFCGFPTHHCFGCTILITCIGCTHYGYITANCQFLTHGGGCGAISPVCGGSIDPTIVQNPAITREQIAQLKEQLQKEIVALDEYAKDIGPATAKAIDAREKQLNEELAQLKSFRKDIGKK
jgi:hypothetical protein